MINVFIDSNILYQDYFFQNKFSDKLKTYVEYGVVKLHMSEIVKLELRKQLENELIEFNSDIQKLKKKGNRLRLEETSSLITVDEELDKFDLFYKGLDYYDHFVELPCKDEFLPDIIDRAINKRKPFTEHKSELKDALIWKTYSEYVEHEHLDNCVLLTNNTSDFCDSKDKSKIHSSLTVDTDKFVVSNSLFQFVQDNASSLEAPDAFITALLSRIELNEAYVVDKLDTWFQKDFEKFIEKEMESLEPSDVFPNEFWMDGYVSGYYSETLWCRDIECEVLGSKALISGIVTMVFDSEVYHYNAARDHGEESYTFVGDASLTYDIFFNFDLDEDEVCSGLEFLTVSLVDIS